jgi:hypothetical protein
LPEGEAPPVPTGGGIVPTVLETLSARRDVPAIAAIAIGVALMIVSR